MSDLASTDEVSAVHNPSDWVELKALVGTVKYRTYGKSAQVVDAPAVKAGMVERIELEEDEVQVNLGFAVSSNPDLWGIRVSVQYRDEKIAVSCDTALLYHWDGVVEFDIEVESEFLVHEAIPRLIASASIILTDAAAGVHHRMDGLSFQIEEQAQIHAREMIEHRRNRKANSSNLQSDVVGAP